VREFEAANPAFLPEADFDAAASGLIQRLSQVVAAHATDPQRCTLIQKQYTRSNEKEPFDRVTIKARLRCDFEQFGPILHELETSNPVLFVDSVQIWRQTGYRTPGTNQVENYLDINFDLYGYIRKHGKAEASGS
jgi:general secretion pathway protein M